MSGDIQTNGNNGVGSGQAGVFSTITGTTITASTGFVGGTAAFGVTTLTPLVRSSGIASYFTINTPADTGITAATEAIGLNLVTGTRTWATTGIVALQEEVKLAGPTYASAAASQTFTDAATLSITPPIAGTNAIFTRGHSLLITDTTSAASSVTGGLVVATTPGTAATSVGIGSGIVNAGTQLIGPAGSPTTPGLLTGNMGLYNATNNAQGFAAFGTAQGPEFRPTFTAVASTHILGFLSGGLNSGLSPDAAFSRDSAGVIDVGTGAQGSTAGSMKMTNVSLAGKPLTINGVATAGSFGVPAIVATGRVTAQTAAAASISTFTVGASDGSFEVSGNVLVTASTTHNFTMTVTYTDEGNTSRTLTLNFSSLAGVLATAIINTGGTSAYEGVPLHIRCKAATTITFATVGTFTSVTYNAEGIIKQMA